MKKGLRLLLAIALLCAGFVGIFSYADGEAKVSPVTWDGKQTTLKELAKHLNYDLVDEQGGYKPMYSYFAEELWEKGLFLGSDGSFKLDEPLTRSEGVAMLLRILGKEEEAKNANFACPFTDVADWAKPYVAYAAKNKLVAGYSESIFGANDPMTANQYLTLVLRALEYDDKLGDFSWDKAAEKALQIGLIGSSCKEQYMRSNLFLRDNVAMISYKTLNDVKTKSGKELGDAIVEKKPTGKRPYPTMAEKRAAEGSSAQPDLAHGSYEGFAVRKYENVDPAAVPKVLKQEENLLFLVYTDDNDKEDEYEALLQASGFYSQGDVKIGSERVHTVTGGIVKSGSKAWECDWYTDGKTQVVFGEVGDTFIVRIYKGSVDTFSANGLRVFYKLIQS
ncbi:MAG: S-layer homology domain-containing protein [Bacillota bacterium]|nr:S-layer homology domain-containing protein [Bacillota bacterium]